MIYVHRDWEQIPDNVKAALKAAAEELDKIGDAKERKEYIDANRDKWSLVRDFLAGMSHGKCWYSEAREAVSRYQIDHFRPHGRAKQGPRNYAAGYSWLAFDIDNFRLAGMLCNAVNQEYSEESVGKGDWFPLADPARRASLQDRGTGNETPILLDPTDPDDPYKLWFNEDGSVLPDGELPAETQAGIEEAINCLGLRQSQLNGKRKSIMRRALRAVVRYKAVDRVPKGNRTLRDLENLDIARGELLAMSASAAEFAAAVRCLLIAYRLKQLIRADELKPLQLANEDV